MAETGSIVATVCGQIAAILQGFLFALEFAGAHVLEKPDCNRVVGVAQSLNPMLHDLHIAQAAKSPKRLLRSFFHFFPGRIGIHGHQPVRERSAAPEGHSQVMHGICLKPGGCALAFSKYSLHPCSQPQLGFRSCRDRCWSCSH